MKRVEYLIEKFDAIAEKLGKQNVMLIAFITVVLLVTGLYSTFSLYTSLDGVQIIDGLTTYKFVLDPEMGETSVIIAANTSKMIDIVVTNNEDIALKYGIYYNSTNNLSNVALGYVTSSPYKATDNVEVGGANKVTLKISNNSSSNVTINFGLSYGTPDGGELNLPSGNNWVSTFYDYLANVEPGSYVEYVGMNGCMFVRDENGNLVDTSSDRCEGLNKNYLSGTGFVNYCGSNSSYTFDVEGWRVAYTEGENAYLISAGSPECVKTMVEGESSALGKAFNFSNIQYELYDYDSTADYSKYNRIINYSSFSSSNAAGWCFSTNYNFDASTGKYYLTGDIMCYQTSIGGSYEVGGSSNLEGYKYAIRPSELVLDNFGYGSNYLYEYKGDFETSITGWTDTYDDNDNQIRIPSKWNLTVNYDYRYNYDTSDGLSHHVSSLNNKALKYCNKEYSYRGVCDNTTAWAMNGDDYQKMIGSTLNEAYRVKKDIYGYGNDLIDNGGYYWIANQYSTAYEAFAWSPSSLFIYSTTSNNDFGLRPVLKLDSSVVVTGGSGTKSDPYTIAINQEDKAEKEEGNVANEPNLDEGMIPVVFDSSNDSWKKISSSNTNYNWYDYNNKKWANSVIIGPDTIIDNSNNARHGVVGAAATWDKEEKVVTTGATGATDYVSLGLENFNFGSSFSFSIRLKFNKLSTEANNYFLANVESAGWGAYLNKSGILCFQIYVGSTNYAYTSTTTLTTGVWYTIVGTYDGANMSLYLDGTLIGSKAQTGVVKSVAYPVMIGGNPDASSTAVATTTDTAVTVSDVLVFTRALSSSEIASDYTGIPEPSNRNSLLLEYDFSNPYENIEADDVLWKNGGQGNIAFYTWIPRFKYRVWNINRQAGGEDTYAYPAYTKGIDIMWEDGKASTGNVSCTYDVTTKAGASNLSDNCIFQKTDIITVDSVNANYKEAWYTHPAFTFDGKEKTGFWIGKFETTGSTTAPTILPNVTSIRSKSLSALFTTARLFQNYGLSDKVDAHALTNMEWAAVAYLTISDYGLCDGNVCREAYVNNSSSYYTGRSSGVFADTVSNVANGTYDYMGYTVADSSVARNESIVASTTGNVTGVYDLSGGAWEFLMANMVSSTFAFNTSSSGFSTLDAKYYGTYSYGTTQNDQVAYNRTRLGDALAEVAVQTGGSYAWQVGASTNAAGIAMTYNTEPWLARGGASGKTAGIFNSGNDNGASEAAGTIRSAIS